MAHAAAKVPWFPIPSSSRLSQPVSFSDPVVADTLIVSDVHLGLRTSRPGSLLATLEKWRFERLILLGDILHENGFPGFCADSWRLVAFIRELALRRHAQVIWLNGNHDRHLAPLVASLVGIEARESYEWRFEGQRYLAVHGDRFDDFVSRYRRLANAIGEFYAFCQNNLSREGRWPQWFESWHLRMSTLDQTVAKGAVSLGRDHGADVVICGHSHKPGTRHFSGDDGGRPIVYANSGSWVGRPASFLTVDPRGIHLHHCA